MMCVIKKLFIYFMRYPISNIFLLFLYDVITSSIKHFLFNI